MAAIGWKVVAVSAGMGLLVLAPMIGVAWLMGGSSPAPGWRWGFLALSSFGFLTAGFVAGGRRRDVPMIHGALAALGVFAVTAGIGTMSLLSQDGARPAPGAAAVGLLLAVACGVAGALAADWTARRRQRLGASAPRGGGC